MLKLPKRLKTFQTPSHARSPKQERELAGALAGEVTRGSGCGRTKGDVRVKGVLRVEAKTTKHKSFSVTTDMIEKIENAAITEGEVPAIVVELQSRVSVAVIPVYVLEMIAGDKWRS